MSGLRAVRNTLASWFHPPGDLYHGMNLLLLTIIAVLITGMIEMGAHL
jgi:hypothetical protein